MATASMVTDQKEDCDMSQVSGLTCDGLFGNQHARTAYDNTLFASYVWLLSFFFLGHLSSVTLNMIHVEMWKAGGKYTATESNWFSE